jgi:hypothetical protein
MIKIPLQHTDTTIVCCEEMLAYDEFLLMPSSDPYEWMVCTVDYWAQVETVLKRLFIERKTEHRLQRLVLQGHITELFRAGNHLPLPEHIIQNSKNCVGYVRLFFRDIEKS